MPLKISQGLAESCNKSPERSAWLSRLPELLQSFVRDWSLTLDSPIDTEFATCSYVVPAIRTDGSRAILKIAMPHFEGEHEIQGLRFWDGDPTARLLRADENLDAMLLERCEPGTPLRTLPEPEQHIVIAGLLRRMWRVPPAGHLFRPLSALMNHWSQETLSQSEDWPDPGLVQEGLHLFSELPLTAPTQVLLATDLHASNVLRSQREPWLAIDPKPFLGDPAYDVTQHLFNCLPRLHSDPHGTIRRLAGLLGVDHERIRLWLFARAAAEPRDDWRNSPRLQLARAIRP
jgi:streptomycin 6-kinase